MQLQNAGFDLDEILNTVYSGKLENTGRRLTPYKAFLVPQTNRILLECDSPNNKAYIFDLELLARLFGREATGVISLEERQEIAENLLKKKKSELLDLIGDNPGVGVAIEHAGRDWISEITAALTEPLDAPAEHTEGLHGFKNRPLDHQISSPTYGLFTTPEGGHYGPQAWVYKYIKEQLHATIG